MINQVLLDGSELAMAISVTIPIFAFVPAGHYEIQRVEKIASQSVVLQASKKAKKKTTRRSGKEKADDKPSWVSLNDVDRNKTPQQNARELLDQKYGAGNWKTGPASEYNMIVKWIARSILYYID